MVGSLSLQTAGSSAFEDMNKQIQVRGQNLIFSYQENISKLDMILRKSSKALRKAVLGQLKRKMKTFSNLHQFRKMTNKKLDAFVCKTSKGICPLKRSTNVRRVIVNIRRRSRPVIRYKTHSCIDATRIRCIKRKPGMMIFAKRSNKMFKQQQKRIKATKTIDFRQKALSEISKIALKEASMKGFPCIPSKMRDDCKQILQQKLQNCKRMKSKIEVKKYNFRKKIATKALSKKRKKKKKSLQKASKSNYITPMPIGDWKIIVQDRPKVKPSDNDEKENAIFLSSRVQNVVSYEDIKTPTDRWKMIQTELPSVKMWNKKFPKFKVKSRDRTGKSISKIEDDTISKYINEEAENRIRNAVFSTWNSKSKAKEFKSTRKPQAMVTKNKVSIFPKFSENFISHISPPDSPERAPRIILRRYAKKKKQKDDLNSDLLNEILKLQNSSADFNLRPKGKTLRNTKVRRKLVAKRRHPRKSEPFHSEDLLVAVNRSTSFWYELTSRTQTSSTIIEKHKLPIPSKSQSSSSGTSAHCSRRSSMDPRQQHVRASKLSHSRSITPSIRNKNIETSEESMAARVTTLLNSLFPDSYQASASPNGWTLAATSLKNISNQVKKGVDLGKKESEMVRRATYYLRIAVF